MTAKFSKEARRAVNTGTPNQVTISVFKKMLYLSGLFNCGLAC